MFRNPYFYLELIVPLYFYSGTGTPTVNSLNDIKKGAEEKKGPATAPRSCREERSCSTTNEIWISGFQPMRKVFNSF